MLPPEIAKRVPKGRLMSEVKRISQLNIGSVFLKAVQASEFLSVLFSG